MVRLGKQRGLLHEHDECDSSVVTSRNLLLLNLSERGADTTKQVTS